MHDPDYRITESSIEKSYMQNYLLTSRVSNPNMNTNYSIWDAMCSEQLLCHREAITEAAENNESALQTLYDDIVTNNGGEAFEEVLNDEISQACSL